MDRRPVLGHPDGVRAPTRRAEHKQIGEKLFLSPRTVSTHLYQLFPKLGVTSRTALRDALEQLAAQ